MKSIKLAAVVVLYNPSDDNIKNINKYIDEVNNLYVIDNSEDDTIRIKETKKIKYIKYYDNKGIATALNDAAKTAIDNNYEWLLTLDQDSEITSKIIKDMKRFLLDSKIDRIGLISPYHDIDTIDEIPEENYTDIIEIMTSGNIINLAAYQEIDGFKDWLFIDNVDTEYCMNLHRHNYKVLRLNKIIMKHHLGDYKVHHFLGKDYRVSNHSAIRRYYMVRNSLYINDMYKDIYNEYCSFLIRIQKGQAKRVLLFERDKLKKILMMYRGYRDYKNKKKGKYQ